MPLSNKSSGVNTSTLVGATRTWAPSDALQARRQASACCRPEGVSETGTIAPMPVIETRLCITATIDKVFAISQDYAVRLAWDPFPDEIRVLHGDPQNTSVGTEVRVKAKSGLEMDVRFVQWDPPHRAAVVMVRGPWMLADFAGSWIFNARDDRSTDVRFRYQIRTRPAWLRWAMQPVALAYFQRVATQRLAGLRHYCEGKPS